MTRTEVMNMLLFELLKQATTIHDDSYLKVSSAVRGTKGEKAPIFIHGTIDVDALADGILTRATVNLRPGASPVPPIPPEF
jgi:hypothetical protein